MIDNSDSYRQGKSVLVSIVSYNSAEFLRPCIQSLRAQEGFQLGDNLQIIVRDNASSDWNSHLETELESKGLKLIRNSANLGFCRAHNQSVYEFLQSSSDYLLILNPDVSLTSDCLMNLVDSIEEHQAGMATPLLRRATETLEPIDPPIIDAAGMKLSLTLRHFDRGSGEIDRGQFLVSEYVFGGTGACLLLSRDAVSKLLLQGQKYEEDLYQIYPELRGTGPHAPLFDDAFFAYREDADLCWRAARRGILCRYAPEALAYHRRGLQSTRRSAGAGLVNALSVRNRFLLQINNFSWKQNAASIIPGLLLRNLLVIFGVLLFEWKSIPALLQVFSLWNRAMERRREI